MLHVTLNMIRPEEPEIKHTVCLFTRKTLKPTTSNLRQAVMLPRLEIHSTVNDNVNLFPKTDVLIY